MRDAQQNNPSGESFPKACKIEPDTIEDASQIIGVKRNLTEFSADAEETKDDSRKSPTLIADANDEKSKLSPKKEDVTYDVMSIVKGTGH
ncbi:hypothetical protein Q3G72_020787 [Acer saccharum]|nr:hypothetical protein Q3G72_020787 [Acer saccharum]